jgi:hypothetical protein
MKPVGQKILSLYQNDSPPHGWSVLHGITCNLSDITQVFYSTAHYSLVLGVAAKLGILVPLGIMVDHHHDAYSTKLQHGLCG